jgi:hypothetical protein
MGFGYCLFLVGFLLCLSFDPEDGSNMFLEEVSGVLLDYILSHPRI